MPGLAIWRAAFCARWTVEHPLHLIAGSFVNEGARDIGVVALDGAAIIAHDDLAFANDSRGGTAVRQ